MNISEINNALVICKEEGLSVNFRFEAAGKFLPRNTYYVNIRKGDITNLLSEVSGRSEVSFEEAFDKAISELHAAGKLSERIEPATRDADFDDLPWPPFKKKN